MATKGKSRRTGNSGLDSILDEMQKKLDTVPTKIWSSLPPAKQLSDNQKHFYHDEANSKYYRVYRVGDDVFGIEAAKLNN